MKKIKLLTLASLGIASITLLAACGTQKSSSTNQNKVTTVTVATSGASVPYEYS